MGNKIQVIRGTTNVFEIPVTDADGNMYELGYNEKLLFGVKEKPEDEEYVILKTITSGTDGVYTAELAPDDTSGLQYGRYVYDVGLQSNENYYNVIEPSPFVILPNVTKWGDGS